MLARLSSKRILLGFVLSFYYLLMGHKLLRLGKHGDGIEYACVARNMAEGWGSFWKPYLSDTVHPVFHEHPPLVFWIQSIGFRLFGDGVYFEAFYGLIIGLTILLCTALLWKRVRRDFQLAPVGSWWPMLLVAILPLFTYFLQTNRLVITFTILALLAVYFSYLSAVAKKYSVLYSVLSGLWIYLGFIAKGPVACFTFAVPIIVWLAFRTGFLRAVIRTLIAVITFAFFLLATFYLFPDSLKFWKGFWQAQVVLSLTSQRAAGDTHWYLVERWILEMIVPVITVGVMMVVARVPLRQIRFNRQALFFFLIALVGSLPFLISARQHARYILHSFPFYVLSLAFLADNVALHLENVLANKRKIHATVAVATMLVFVVGMTTMFYKKDYIARKRPFYEDFFLQDIKMPQRILVSVCPEEMIHGDWLFADMQRFYKVSLTGQMGNDYYIIDKHSTCRIPEGYQRVHRQPTVKYVLYRKSSLQDPQ